MTSRVMSFAIIRLEARVRVPSASGVVNLSFFFRLLAILICIFYHYLFMAKASVILIWLV